MGLLDIKDPTVKAGRLLRRARLECAAVLVQVIVAHDPYMVPTSLPSITTYVPRIFARIMPMPRCCRLQPVSRYSIKYDRVPHTISHASKSHMHQIIPFASFGIIYGVLVEITLILGQAVFEVKMIRVITAMGHRY